MTNRITVREARRGLSKILASGNTAVIGQSYGPLRGFLVGVPPHNEYNDQERRAALKKAKAAFQAALVQEWR